MISVLAYLGLADLLAGAVALIWPRLFRLRNRRRVAPFFVTGIVLASVGAWWPHSTRRSTQGTLLALSLPQSQFGEFHSTVVRATPEAVFRAIRSVTADEIRFFRLLTWIRSPRLPGAASGESVLAPDWHAPILNVALRGGFVLLGEIPDREMVIGTVVCCRPSRVRRAEDFRSLTGPGYARAAMDFRAESLGDGTTRLTTATRVLAVGAGARRRFGLYWSLIYPGSSLIRWGWLETIRTRAEQESSSP